MPTQRLRSLDVFRGLTVAAMILVTNPGTYAARFHPLQHADWNGANATDIIFPCFLLAIGVSITLSSAARQASGATRTALALQVLRRTALLLLLGLLVNAFPDFHWPTLRLPGILQHIALCYALAAGLYLALPTRIRTPVIAFTIPAILLAYYAALTFYPVPGIGPGHLDTFGNLPAYVDRSLFTIPHLWLYGTTPGMGVTFDPDGLLVTFPSLTTTLFGILAGDWLSAPTTPTRKVLALIGAGALLIALALAWEPYFVINKKIWSSSFALLSGGIAIILFAAFYTVVDLWRSRAGTLPALIFGTNAILAFVISGIFTTASDRLHAGPLTLHRWAYQHILLTGLAPIRASLLYAILVVLFNLAILSPLYRRRIFLRL